MEMTVFIGPAVIGVGVLLFLIIFLTRNQKDKRSERQKDLDKIKEIKSE